MVRLANKPKKVKPAKPLITVDKDDRLLVMTQRGGKLKAHTLRAAVGAHRKRLLDRNIKDAFLVVSSREDLMFVKEEYKFHRDRLRALETQHAAAVRKEVSDFFAILEHSNVFRPRRVRIVWEAL